MLGSIRKVRSRMKKTWISQEEEDTSDIPRNEFADFSDLDLKFPPGRASPARSRRGPPFLEASMLFLEVFSLGSPLIRPGIVPSSL
jgi:hypothetical protein